MGVFQYEKVKDPTYYGETGWRRIPITDIMDRWKKWSSMWKTSVTV